MGWLAKAALKRIEDVPEMPILDGVISRRSFLVSAAIACVGCSEGLTGPELKVKQMKD